MKQFWRLQMAGCLIAAAAMADWPAQAREAGRLGIAQEEITARGLAEPVAFLANDRLEGRFPGTAGERKTLEYLQQSFRQLGLQPPPGGNYLQEVPLVEMIPDTKMSITFQAGGHTWRIGYGSGFTVSTPRITGRIEVTGRDMVFAGYGIVAPEWNWDDYAGVDVRGRVVLLLASDPGQRNPEIFGGRALTWYGTMNYKVEEAARRGAAGVLLIHQPESAGYLWNAERFSRPRPRFTFEAPDRHASRCAFEGWINETAAAELLRRSGWDLAAAIDAAGRPGFRPRILRARLDLSFRNNHRRIVSHNAVAIWPGTDRTDECVLLSAHWDHLGRDRKLKGDQIYNGAADNAVGVSALLQMAKACIRMGPARRSIVFLFPTAEERGLLGSAWYAAHPVFTIAKTVANYNVDGLFPFGPCRDAGVIGWGYSELDGRLQAEADAEGRAVTPDRAPEQGYFFRLDMFSFARQGIPAHHIGTGTIPEDPAEHSRIKTALGEFYHRPGDEYRPELWDWTGIVRDVRLIFRLVYRLADSDETIQWQTPIPWQQVKPGTRRFQGK